MIEYTPEARMIVKARAKKALGKDGPTDKFEFMQECIDELGDATLCEMLWEELGGED